MVNLHTKRRIGWCALLCAVCILLTLFSHAPKVQAAGAGYIYGSTNYAEAGGKVTVYFAISGNPGIWGLKGSVSYDSSVMTLDSVSEGNVFSVSEMTMADVSQNPFTFLATGSAIADKTKDGVIIRLTFVMSKDVNLGEHTVSISISQAINADGKDVSVSSSNAKIKVVSCLHSTTYLKDVVEATETEEGYSGDTYCKKCEKLVTKGTVTPKVVNTCEHKNKNWQVTVEATCEADGKKELICDDCNKHLEEEVISKTGHEKTVIVNQKAPTTTEEGFTGNVHCEKCDALLEEGTVVPKIKILVFHMTTLSEDAYFRGSQTGLVFVSDAELETFVRVEVDGVVLDEQAYALESGSTKVTLVPEYLESLSDGKHTVTIVSDAGTASAQFRIAVEEKAQIPSSLLLIITIVAVAVSIGCVVFTLIATGRKNKVGRYSDNHEE